MASAAAAIKPFNCFVYGTLMNGFSNSFLMKECKFIGRATTVNKYALFTNEYPFVNSKIAQTEIQGEVYEVSKREELEWLDELEGHPDVYIRTAITAVLEGTTEAIPVQIYFYDRAATEGEGVETVPSGSFRDSVTASRHVDPKDINTFRIPWSEIESNKE
ncbi:Butirosin biosynthesis, BtrG-like protein [Ochromonadaceae sp. CCMP2298]|nr:Butirosin biosynthesis, BtrG-like protein [Ochromonadaceae sp. CCMP2298]|mmetsp:Transcript_10218/g.22675  ORF Transcript_10218/g.22675 Transcript_10218/m.22675 type:complete len:161 (-) Transcript_10218:7-489(-)|eukprot:CAMPEP_0173197996 /NCGR_PEP_ID=MMETSP1141-20130122/16456_1 /TAXON_ID=483371 /ORGANISM="non described non described, Strain CCMP2298" /LENGTH=160 /DNA_ID=CAMNT_0014122769 /DNA_START=55 /DNA_END=537 /DNA_ORIENTATION=-